MRTGNDGAHQGKAATSWNYNTPVTYSTPTALTVGPMLRPELRSTTPMAHSRSQRRSLTLEERGNLSPNSCDLFQPRGWVRITSEQLVVAGMVHPLKICSPPSSAHALHTDCDSGAAPTLLRKPASLIVVHLPPNVQGPRIFFRGTVGCASGRRTTGSAA